MQCVETQPKMKGNADISHTPQNMHGKEKIFFKYKQKVYECKPINAGRNLKFVLILV